MKWQSLNVLVFSPNDLFLMMGKLRNVIKSHLWDLTLILSGPIFSHLKKEKKNTTTIQKFGVSNKKMYLLSKDASNWTKVTEDIYNVPKDFFPNQVPLFIEESWKNLAWFPHKY